VIRLSDDHARLDIDRIHGWLTTSYWSPGISRSLVGRAIAGSHCLGAYDDGHDAGDDGSHEGGPQVGFARAITDHATFAWIADVWVDESARGQGLGRRLVGWFLDHPDFAGLRRIGLVTADAHGVYAPLGFHPPLRPDRYMERLDPAAAALLAIAP
jgi:GNAT superfamily N-acetyltransferase